MVAELTALCMFAVKVKVCLWVFDFVVEKAKEALDI